MKKLSFLLFLISPFLFSQELEENIYVAAETFIKNKNSTSLKRLSKQESIFKTQAKTKEEQLALVFLQCNKGYYLGEISKLKEAIITFEDALKRFNSYELSRFSDFDIIESCLNPLGNLYTKTGDYTNAVSTITQYIFLAEKSKNTKHQISGAINLAKLYQTIGKKETAIKIIEDALKLSRISEAQKSNLETIKTNYLITLNKQNKTSILNNTSTVSTYLKQKNEYLIELQNGNYIEALIAFENAKKHLSEVNLSNRYLAKFHIEEAQLFHLLKKQNNALKSLQTAIKILLPNFNANGLPKKSDLYAENTFIDIFDLYAAIQPNSKIALESLNLSFYVSKLLQHSWTSQETKILNETNNRIRSEACIDILFNTYNQTKDKSILFEAFQYSENNKASVLKENFIKRRRLQRFSNDSLLIKEFNLLQEQERITNLLINERLNANIAFNINLYSQQLSDISLQIKQLKIAIENKYPKTDNAYFSLKTLQDKLTKDNAILVEYFYGKNTIYQFVISNTGIELNPIHLDSNTKESITNFISLFDNASVINNDISNFTFQAFNMFKLLKLDASLAYKNVIIIPDGLLNFIPFESLLTSKTNTTSFSKMPFIIKNQKIAYNSTVLLYLNDTQKSNNNNLLGFFPVFENTNQSLIYSIDEANTIKNEMSSTIFINENASKINFIKNITNYGILHLSTHASGGGFTKPANISFYDDTMFLNELYSLNLKSDLVVLSACETGIGKLHKGEGAMSIARGFQYAGAENLLFSLWQINDLSTSQIMQSFYKNYKQNQSGFIANHNSKIEYLENSIISNSKKSPYFWSAFVYYGSLESTKSQNFTLYIFFGAIILLIALFLFFKRKKT